MTHTVSACIKTTTKHLQSCTRRFSTYLCLLVRFTIKNRHSTVGDQHQFQELFVHFNQFGRGKQVCVQTRYRATSQKCLSYSVLKQNHNPNQWMMFIRNFPNSILSETTISVCVTQYQREHSMSW